MNLASAYELHQAGRYADAARAYQALLDRDPENADVLHLFGVMHHQCGYSARAAELTGWAIALRPEVAAYHANLAEIQRALGQLPLIGQHLPEVGVSTGQLLVQRDGGPERLGGLGRLAQCPQRVAAVVLSHREVRPEGQGGIVLRDRFLILPQLMQGQAEVVERLGVVRPQAQGHAAAGGSLLVLAQATLNLGEVGMIGGDIGPQRDGPARQLGGAGGGTATGDA